MLVSKVQKWGNSQGLRLPKTLLDIADISVGDEVEIVVRDKSIVLQKVAQAKFDLKDLVARIPKGYKAEETKWGGPVGKEEW